MMAALVYGGGAMGGNIAVGNSCLAANSVLPLLFFSFTALVNVEMRLLLTVFDLSLVALAVNVLMCVVQNYDPLSLSLPLYAGTLSSEILWRRSAVV